MRRRELKNLTVDRVPFVLRMVKDFWVLMEEGSRREALGFFEGFRLCRSRM